jgi:hypothetical protein
MSEQIVIYYLTGPLKAVPFLMSGASYFNPSAESAALKKMVEWNR